MGKFYLAYMDTWGDPDKKVVFHIPDETSVIPSIERVSSVTAAIAVDARFDPTLTLFAPSVDWQTRLINFGFTDVRLYSEYQGRKAYIASNAYIQFGSGTSTHIHFYGPGIDEGNYTVASTSGVGAVHTLYNGLNGYNGAQSFQVSRFYLWNTFDARMYGAGASGAKVAEFWSLATPYVPPTPSTDPYDWNEPTGPSDPLPEHTIVQNNVDFPTVPTAAAINAGFVSVWVPQLFQVQNLANYMWNINLLSADFWKKLVASPLELIYGLSIIPYDFRSAESEYEVHTDNLTLGYVNTKLSMDYIEEQFIDVDMGEIDMKEWAGAYLDYDPQTRISIYLPYIGVKDLNADDVMRKVISLKYRIDLASGACIAMLKCTGTDDVAGEVDSVFYSFPGTCTVSIPVSASQQQELLRSIVSLGIGVTATVATIASGVTAMGAATAVGATANGALGLKSHYAHSGALGSSPGFMGVQTPYLIINRPRLAIPEYQNVYMGYPSFITKTLGDLSGYTEVEVTHLDRLSCTEEEMSEIAELLKKGVFF